MARAQCPNCGTEQELATDRPGGCVICGRALDDALPAEGGFAPPGAAAPTEQELEAGQAKRITRVFEVEDGDLTAHAASLPAEAPKSRFREIEELFAGQKRSGTILSFVPLWGLWRISRSPDHTGGEKLFLSVLSIVLTVAIAFGASRWRPGEEVRLAGIEERVEEQIVALSRIVREFVAERGRYPAEEDWNASASQADSRFFDPWGRPYVYEHDPLGFRIGSYGRDGKPGGREEDADFFREFRAEAAGPKSRSAVTPPVTAARHVILAGDACPALDLASEARLELDGVVHVNARCASPSAAVRLAPGARLAAGSAIGLVSGTPPAGDAVSPQARAGLDPVPDPLVDLPAPAFDGRTFVTAERPGGLPTRHGAPGNPRTRLVEEPAVLAPGVYWGGIRVVSGGDATLQPGEYVLAGGGLLVLGTGRLSGQGVVLYNTVDPFAPGGLGGFEQILCSAESRLALSAPTAGLYQGLAVFQDRANPRPMELACEVDLDGALYAPSAELRLAGPGGTMRTRILVGRLTTQSSFTIRAPSQSLSIAGTARLRFSPTIPGFA